MPPFVFVGQGKRKDAELNTIYKLNECEFRIYPQETESSLAQHLI